jgi:hypothetical protein
VSAVRLQIISISIIEIVCVDRASAYKSMSYLKESVSYLIPKARVIILT